MSAQLYFTAGLARISWRPESLSWELSYDGQVWATQCAYLPGRPQMDAKAARAWADELIGVCDWQPVVTAVSS